MELDTKFELMRRTRSVLIFPCRTCRSIACPNFITPASCKVGEFNSGMLLLYNVIYKVNENRAKYIGVVAHVITNISNPWVIATPLAQHLPGNLGAQRPRLPAGDGEFEVALERLERGEAGLVARVVLVRPRSCPQCAVSRRRRACPQPPRREPAPRPARRAPLPTPSRCHQRRVPLALRLSRRHRLLAALIPRHAKRSFCWLGPAIIFDA